MNANGPFARRKSSIRRTGTPWSNHVNEAFATYLRGFAACTLQMGKRALIDALVGCPYQSSEVPDRRMPGLATGEPRSFLDGFTVTALETNPSFDSYLFLDQHAERARHVHELTHYNAGRPPQVEVRANGADAELERLLSLDWTTRRAVILLDPFGMNVPLRRVEAIAATRTIDLLVMWPVALDGAEDLLAASPPAAWVSALDAFVATDAWRAEPTIDTVGAWLQQRIAAAFTTVPQQAAILRGPDGAPLYACVFGTHATGQEARLGTKLLGRLATPCTTTA